MKVLTQYMTQYIPSHHELGSNCDSLSIQASKAIKLEDTCCSLPSPSCKLKSISPPEGTRVETGKGGEMGLGKNGPFVSPNGSFVGNRSVAGG